MLQQDSVDTRNAPIPFRDTAEADMNAPSATPLKCETAIRPPAQSEFPSNGPESAQSPRQPLDLRAQEPTESIQPTITDEKGLPTTRKRPCTLLSIFKYKPHKLG